MMMQSKYIMHNVALEHIVFKEKEININNNNHLSNSSKSFLDFPFYYFYRIKWWGSI